MTDARRLATGLAAYIAALERHFALLREQHGELTAVWGPTRESYQGTGADVFAAAFERADAEFRHYLDQGQRIVALLKERQEALERFDRSGGEAV